MLLIWACGVCHMERLYVIVGDVLCVVWGGCMWSWGRFWVGGQQEYEKPMFYPSISVNLKMLWKKRSLKRKKGKPRKKNPVIPFMLMSWVILCWMALPVNLCQLNWTCFESHWVYTTGNHKQPGQTLSAVLVHSFWHRWQWYQVHAHVLEIVFISLDIFSCLQVPQKADEYC